ncbi:hypothetical protein [Halobacillus halophilus]|uniref:hypothetical protein n=1 Tax=Halobacillus halophilus TaxID=1570 RepID=UPI001CD6CDBF|nr:hypothetical protein [Halobacillus halophilus]MCA1010056.1 hypothetical protein [Halobacillus halophilus]
MIAKGELRKLRLKQFILLNATVVLVFLGLDLYIAQGFPFKGMIWLLGFLFLMLGAGGLYQMKTGKILATKDSKRLVKYEREVMGEKAWKRHQKSGVIIILILAVAAFVAASVIDFPLHHTDRGMDPASYIGAFIGINLGTGIRSYRIDKKGAEKLD